MHAAATSSPPAGTAPDAVRIAALIDDRPAEGVFRVHRDAYRDPAVFALEMRELFGNGWACIGHASQAPRPHDFFTVTLGGVPLIVMRDGAGRLGAFINSCRHKGAMVCVAAAGNRQAHVCPYHSWSYASDGRNTGIKARAAGAYAEAFDAEDHDLARVPCFGDAGGFLFASLGAAVPALADWLGDARVFLDMVAEQSSDGVELLPGAVTYTYRGNWKLQLENSLDAYHLTSVHPSYFGLIDRRARMAARADVAAAVWQGERGRQVEEEMGAFGFAQGHTLVWTATPEARHPLFANRAALAARVGEGRARWMMRTRQFNLFPNLQLASNAALQMRVIRPLAVDLTEITSYCAAPVGESREARRARIRQYEDFFNPSGMATPDDIVIFEDSQRGFASGEVQWQQGAARGMRAVVEGPDVHARELGIRPASSMHGPFSTADETVLHAMYRAWRARLVAALAREAAR